jgi:signal transduction histidine kinase
LTVALRQLDLLETGLRKFLDLGRADDLRRQRCDLAALVSEAVALLTPQARHAGTALEWRPPAEAWFLDGDPGQLAHLLVNLLGNALDAAGPGGDVQLRLEESDGEALLTISDSGPGPPTDLAERLFEPFTTGKPGGVGLGLAAARQVAERHGGSVGWERLDGRTLFHVRLPRSPNGEPS